MIKPFLLALFVLIMSATSVLGQQKKTYVVKPGDTLYGISKTLSVSIAEIKNWNNLSSNSLSVGQELTYFEEAQQTPPPASSDEPLVTSAPVASNTFYTVKSGDNLYTIARIHNMTLAELKNLNNLTSDNIQVGQRLSVKEITVAPSVTEFSEDSSPQGVFTRYTVKRNETLSSILARFSMQQYELQALNPAIDLDRLDRGQTITILLPPSRTFPNPYLAKANLQDLGSLEVLTYSEDEFGKVTTSGELYNPERLTAAHSNIALGSLVYIERDNSEQGIYILINDRITTPGLKLSSKAFRMLGLSAEQPGSVAMYTNRQ
ncbi:MAG: LysM peptidoglycan-binding domain-containing protein [Bacteroidota bacterium]